MVGFDEIIFIAVIALLLFGPDKLPQYIREVGKFYAQIKQAQRELELEFNRATIAATPLKQPSPAVIEIARKMGIAAEGKTEEQLLAEIDVAVSSNAGKA